MKRSTIASAVVIFLLIPATLYLGTQLSGKGYYLTSTLLIVEIMLPFFLRFESRRPQARELATLAVMCALAVTGRVAIPIPNFKIITGIVMIAGIAFGAEAGFLTGAISAFASNFFFSQGPWTSWQMLSYGMGGFLAGLLFFPMRAKLLEKKSIYLPALTLFGFLGIVLAVGPLLDCSTLFAAASRITWRYALAVFTAGFPHNLTHGLSCAATLLLLTRPLLRKLLRLQEKYGTLA